MSNLPEVKIEMCIRDSDNTKGVSKCRLQMYVFVRSPRKAR